jgi:hypothetical protein
MGHYQDEQALGSWTSQTRGDFAPHVCQAIYRFDGDQLVLCYPRPYADLPARFKSTPGSGLTLTQWQRVGN